MTNQDVSKPNVSDDEAVYANQAMFGKLGELTRTNPHAASVMLTLMARMGTNGAVQVTQATVAKLCNYTLQQVEKAITDLAEANWILSVDASPEPGGLLTCILNPSFARSENPDEAVFSRSQ